VKTTKQLEGIYQHYKGNHYEVIAIGHHEETHEEMVVYRAMHDLSQIWIRPKAVFFSDVTHEGQQVARFKLVSRSTSQR
jgi:hypothetical protein